MNVKCRICGKSVDRDFAFKTIKSEKNYYCCSEAEYLESVKETECKNNIKLLTKEVFGRIVLHSSLNKELNQIYSVYPPSDVERYLVNNKDYLSKIMGNKSFSSEFNKIRYYCAIISNQMQDFLEKNPQEKPSEDKTELLSDNYTSKYKPKTRKKKSLSELW